ncbi:MAG: hypothetical protein JWN45_1862 [Acidobacteriaceae bacterium]|nr:hypothetical protein [Acidobacteriaceae bacterium]
MLLINPHWFLAILAAGIASSLTDWFFFGVLFHDKYLQFPEVWRSGPNKTETKKIVLSTLLGVFSCAAFILLCAGLGLHSYSATLKLAVAVWLIAFVPTVLTYHVFVKLNSALAVSHSLGYLARRCWLQSRTY